MSCPEEENYNIQCLNLWIGENFWNKNRQLLDSEIQKPPSMKNTSKPQHSTPAEKTKRKS